MTTTSESYRAARDFLLENRENYDKAVAEFRWPDITGTWNWATDWFDGYARGNDRTALWIVEEDGSEEKFTFDHMVTRSDKLAAWLVEQGIGKGDPVILMLNNQVELWDSMLAIMKLGGVIMPTTTALQAADLQDRVQRAGAKAVIANPVDAGKFYRIADQHPDVILMSVGEGPEGWADMRAAQDRAEAPAWTAQTQAEDPLLLYFTSGTTSKPKLVHAHPGELSGGPPVDDVLGRPEARRHAPDDRRRRAGPSTRGAASSRRGTRRRASSSTTTPASTPRPCWGRCCVKPGDHVVRAADGVAHADPGRPQRQAGLKLRELIGAGEPLNPEVIEQVKAKWGMTIRDGFGQTETTAQVGNSPGQPLKPGLDGPAPARRTVRAARPGLDSEPTQTRASCASIWAPRRWA
jgi:acetyl-CoA synthetase